jgi:hypothetical protein
MESTLAAASGTFSIAHTKLKPVSSLSNGKWRREGLSKHATQSWGDAKGFAAPDKLWKVSAAGCSR